MIGSLITRGLVMVFGYAYPAYECYKTVDKNKADVEQLRFWCQYWILVAMLTIFERVGDALISWVPMYSEAKLVLYIYLWYPKTKGTAYVYDSFFRPYVAKHETEIDRNLLELRTRAGDYAVLFWLKATNFAQTRILDIIQFISHKSTPKPPTTQPKRSPRVRQFAATQNLNAASKAQPQAEAASKAQPQTEAAPKAQSQTEATSKAQPHTEEPNSPTRASIIESPEVLVTKSTEKQTVAGSLKATAPNEEARSTETVSSTSKDVINPCIEDTVMKQASQVAHYRLRRPRTASTR